MSDSGAFDSFIRSIKREVLRLETEYEGHALAIDYSPAVAFVSHRRLKGDDPLVTTATSYVVDLVSGMTIDGEPVDVSRFGLRVRTFSMIVTLSGRITEHATAWARPRVGLEGA